MIICTIFFLCVVASVVISRRNIPIGTKAFNLSWGILFAIIFIGELVALYCCAHNILIP